MGTAEAGSQRLDARLAQVREGVLVARRDAAMLERFVAETVRQYLDVQPLRERGFQILRRNILASADGR